MEAERERKKERGGKGNSGWKGGGKKQEEGQAEVKGDIKMRER